MVSITEKDGYLYVNGTQEELARLEILIRKEENNAALEVYQDVE